MKVADLLRPPSPGKRARSSSEHGGEPARKKVRRPSANEQTGSNQDDAAVGGFHEFSVASPPRSNGLGQQPPGPNLHKSSESTATPASKKSKRQVLPQKRSAPTFILENPRTGSKRRLPQHDEHEDTEFDARKRRRVGRPRKPDEELKRPRNERYRVLDKPTKIHGNSVVRTGLPVEIWDNICLYMDPRTMMNLRTTCKKLNEQISSESFLKRYRELHFGKTCPPPPGGLSEFKYISLLGGVTGCMSCKAKKSQKVQWAFLTRLCEKCLDARVFKIGAEIRLDRSTFVGKYSRLIACIPKAATDTHANYGGVLPNPDPFHLNTVNFQSTMFLKKDFGKIAQEFETFKATIPLDATPAVRDRMITDWVIPRKEACDKQMKPLKEIEEHMWALELHKKNTEYYQRKLFKVDRMVYFQKKCQELDPPIPGELCRLMPPYLQATEYERPPSDASWQLLKPKLEALREAAQEMYQLKAPEMPAPRSVEYERANINHKDHEVHELLQNIAEKVVETLTATTCTTTKNKPVSLCDLPYLSLRKTRAIYYGLNKEQRPLASGTDLLPAQEDGTYTLCMADAEKVYNDVIAKAMSEWPLFRQKEGKVLRCPGCTRKDYFRGRSFKQLFEHLMKNHGKQLGSDWDFYYKKALEYGQYPDLPSGGFPWLAIEWPVNLPIQAPHHKAVGTWDPDDEYFNYECADGQRGESRENAFLQRSPDQIRQRAELPGDLANALTEAWDALKSTTLSNRSKGAIAWRYAIYREGPERRRMSAEANRHLLYAVAVALIRAGRDDVMNDLTCKACAGTTDKHRQKFVDHPRSFLELCHHFRDTHVALTFIRRDGFNWFDVDWLELTSGEDLTEELDADQEARAIFETYFPIFPMGPYAEGDPEGGLPFPEPVDHGDDVVSDMSSLSSPDSSQ